MTLSVVSTVKVPAIAAFKNGAEFDLASLADIKLELQIAHSANDAWLAKVIARISQAVSQFCNRTFQVQTYQDQFWPQRDPFPWQLPGGVMGLQLSQWPIVAQISPAGIAPPAAPLLTAISGGSHPAMFYYARITYLTAEGETAASLESRFMVPANNLLQIASPSLDPQGLAIGWNAYISASSFTETLQNILPMAIGTGFTLPSSGLIKGVPLPPYVTVVENAGQPVSPVNVPPGTPQNLPPVASPLAEGIDFITDQPKGQLTRLFLDGYERKWPALPIVVQYQAGFATIPDDLQEAVIRLVKGRWFARNRDPNVRSENIEGIYEAQYWFGTGPGAPADMPADIAAMLDRNYRIPVIA